MSITFREDRLLVGWTREEWDPVWYQPATATEQGGAELDLFRTSGSHPGEEFRVPKEGEVVWEPFWNPEECGTKVLREKRVKHQQLLSDAWSYLAETDPRALAKMTGDLESGNPSNKRKAWFAIAKKMKMGKVKAAETRQRNKRNRNGNARSALPKRPEEYSSGEDSGNEADNREAADAARESQEGRFPFRAMDPPPAPSRSSSVNPSMGSSGPRGSTRGARSGSQDTDPLFMSERGTPGPSDPPTPQSLNSSRLRRMPGGIEGIIRSRESTVTPPNKRQRTEGGNFNGNGRCLNGPRSDSQSQAIRINDVEHDEDEIEEEEVLKVREGNGGLDDDEALAEAVRASTAEPGDRYARADSVPEETPAP
ncbi:hypothetical protein B0A48_10023 [Cryoendolithus antarcticus]|uniref:Uncharacterized protein n=1 Tax=Cryoendolithus antarcticus TaxID=1507870 RepID=A0A1V8T3D3_9PEZI|nr:hypothetical protein B0A48_10023 [Cryoendolithus antarcticus]